VEYRIDEEGMTIEQVWQYGKERGTDLYSPITSDVDYLPQTGNRLITSGNIRAGAGVARATIVEVTYPNNQVVFEADIEFKDQLGSGEKSWGQFDLVFRGERYPLIPH
jgi:arylsulfate sulfotransferase